MKQKAFSLIEILVVVAVIGLMTATMVRFLARTPADEWKHVLEDVNTIFYAAQQQAIRTRRVHRLVFNVSAQGISTIDIEEEIPTLQPSTVKKFEKTKLRYSKTHYEFPKTITIKELLVGGKKQFADKSLSGAVYITPDSLVQHSALHLLRKKNKEESRVSFVIEPFIGMFELKEGFQKL